VNPVVDPLVLPMWRNFMRIQRTRSVTGVVVGLSLLITACGDDPTVEPVAGPSPETTPVEEPVEAPVDTDVPQAIISLSPTATEMLYAIGAGDQVLAVDDFSNHPPEAVEKMQGLSGYIPNVEAIVGLEPDLVVTDGTNPDLLEQLDALGVPHWEGFAVSTFDEVYTQIEQLGAATGHVAEAAQVVEQMQSEVDEIKAGLPQLDDPLTYYHELDDTFFSVTSDTFIGAVYAEIGLVNIADAVGDGNPYPQLNAEFIVAEDPDLIFLACTKYCGESAETVAARDGWADLTAVRTGGVVEMDDDIASRWGPRVVEYLRVVGDAVAAVAELQLAG
jgi:iron complex transport system substrate-binding protein